MNLIENTPDRRVYLWCGHRAEITLRDRCRWCWRVLDHGTVVGRGSRYTLDRARRDVEIVIEAAEAAERIPA